MNSAQKNISDDELVELIKTGNHRYFAWFAERYESYILKKCMSYVKDSNAAEDLCQEVLIRVFLQLPNFRKEARLTTWLYTIIHNTCIDFLRKKKKMTHEVISEKLADELEDLAEFEPDLSRKKTIEVLEELLEELIPEEKLILLLKYKEKHSISEISKALGVSESAVKMRLSRARERLNKLFEAKEHSE